MSEVYIFWVEKFTYDESTNHLCLTVAFDEKIQEGIYVSLTSIIILVIA